MVIIASKPALCVFYDVYAAKHKPHINLGLFKIASSVLLCLLIRINGHCNSYLATYYNLNQFNAFYQNPRCQKGQNMKNISTL